MRQQQEKIRIFNVLTRSSNLDASFNFELFLMDCVVETENNYKNLRTAGNLKYGSMKQSLNLPISVIVPT